MRGQDATRRCDTRTLYYTPMSAKEAAREAEQGSGRAATVAAAGANAADAVNVHYDTRLPELPWSRRPCSASFACWDRRCATKCSDGSMPRECTFRGSAASGPSGIV